MSEKLSEQMRIASFSADPTLWKPSGWADDVAALEVELLAAKDLMTNALRENMATEAERNRLRSVCSEAYQFAACYNAPVAVLDNLSDAAHGSPLRHETFLPAAPLPDGNPLKLANDVKSGRDPETECGTADSVKIQMDVLVTALKIRERVIADGLLVAYRECADLRSELEAARKAIAVVKALEVTGPSTIGPLHGAGVADGLRWAKEAIDAAMKPEPAKEGE